MYHRWRKGGDHTENTHSSLEPTDIAHQRMHTPSNTTRWTPHLAGDAHSAVWMEQTSAETNISRAPKGRVSRDVCFKADSNDRIRQYVRLLDESRKFKRRIDLHLSMGYARMHHLAPSSKSIPSTITVISHWIPSQNAEKLRKESSNLFIWRIASANCRHM